MLVGVGRLKGHAIEREWHTHTRDRWHVRHVHLEAAITRACNSPGADAFFQRHERDVDGFPLLQLLLRVVLCVRGSLAAC